MYSAALYNFADCPESEASGYKLGNELGMGISVLAEAQKEIRARWAKGVNAVPKKKDEPQQEENQNRKNSKPDNEGKKQEGP